MGHQIVSGGVGMVDQVHCGVDDLAQVVGWDVGGHSHRDALAPVDDQVREAGGQHLGFGELTRVVVDEVDGVFVDAVKKRHGPRIEPALGVARRRWRVVGRVAEVALGVD